jgi:hypothetical protein
MQADAQAVDYQQQMEIEQMKAQLAALQAQLAQAAIVTAAPRAAAPAPQAAAAGGPDIAAQLQQLAQLRNAGVLNDEEFAAGKVKLLAS